MRSMAESRLTCSLTATHPVLPGKRRLMRRCHHILRKICRPQAKCEPKNYWDLRVLQWFQEHSRRTCLLLPIGADYIHQQGRASVQTNGPTTIACDELERIEADFEDARKH
jgi:hypothetical protein